MNKHKPAISLSELERLKSDVEAYLRSGEADTALDEIERSQAEALDALERAERLDSVKLRTPITL